MKDLMSIWGRLAGRQYSAVNTNSNGSSTNGGNVNDVEDNPDTIIRDARRNFRRKSSIVVNQFFNAALPVHRDGRARWPRRESTFIRYNRL